MIPVSNSSPSNLNFYAGKNIIHSKWESSSTTQGTVHRQIRVMIKEDGNIFLQKIEKTTQGPFSSRSNKGKVSIKEETSNLPRNIYISLDQKVIQSLKKILYYQPLAEIPKEINKLIEETLKKTEVVNRNVQVMSQTLNDHVQKKCSEQIQHQIEEAQKKSQIPLSDEKKAAIAQKITKKFQESLTFFTQVDKRKSLENPLERMASTFAYLGFSSAPLFIEGSSEFASHLAVLAFEQHRENPEQYVSHGFDHSINVANYTRDVLEMNPQIVTAMAEKYNINPGEARFLLENVAFLHDTGYPCVGCRGKAVHGISGADLILPMSPMFPKIIQSDQIEKLFNDFRNAIMFHSADKVEYKFGAKIQTTMGTFLADPENIITVLSNFYDPSKNPNNTPRFALDIFVQNSEQQEQIKAELEASHQKFERIYGKSIELPHVHVHAGEFKGRYADLERNRDKLIGLEFSEADLLESPLNMIRLVDNMDMRKTRLTPLQNEPTFREIYARLGDHRGISSIAEKLENFEKTTDNERQKIDKGNGEQQTALSERIEKETQETLNQYLLEETSDPFEQQVKVDLKPYVLSIKTPKEARNLLNKMLINAIFRQDAWSQLSLEKQEEVRFIGMQQSSFDFRHFGGTEAITNVQLKSIPAVEPLLGKGNVPSIVVTVDRTLFEHLNQFEVLEDKVRVGVGEYQIWRASDAYKSLKLGDTNVALRVVDENGRRVECIVNKIIE